jgi:hypothetical protein
MQAPMHFLVGILIFHAVKNPILAFILIFLSHYLIDVLVLLTYHPKDPLPESKFWVRYHILILILTIIMVIFFIKAYFWVMIVSLIPDIVDWVIMRMILKKDPIMHPLIERIRESKVFSWIPDHTMKPIGALYEAIMLSGFFVLYFSLFY